MQTTTPRRNEDTPSSPQTPYNRARDTLRSLREDIVIFQDPTVRNYLETVPTTTPIETPSPSRPPEELHAIIIALRTRLNDTIEDLNTSKKANLESRKRAARAEGQIAELSRALEQREALHDAAVTDASDRIEAMERDRLEGHAKLERDALRMREDAERDRFGTEYLEAERDAALAELTALQDKVSALQRDAAAADKSRKAEEVRRKADADLQTNRVKLLESELEAHRVGREEIASLENGEAASARALADRLQRESIQLKSELQWRNTQVSRLQARLDEAEKEAQSALSDLSDVSQRLENVSVLEREVRGLREAVRDKENTSGDIAALVREKNELTTLICALSPSGNAQEGLRLLQEAASGKPLSQGRAAGRTRRPLGSRHEETIAELRKTRDEEVGRLMKEVQGWKKRAREAEQQLSTVRHEKEVAVAANQRNERMRRVLKKENGHLRAALDEFERDEEIASANGTDSSASRLKNQLQASEQNLAEYKAMVKDLEASVQELTSQLASQKAKEGSSTIDHMSFEPANPENELRKRLFEATRAASLASDAKNAAEAEARRVNAEMMDVRTELERLRLQRPKSAAKAVDEPRDYDPSTTKVLHLQENPLAVALEKEASSKEKATGKKRLRAEAGVKLSPLRTESANLEIAKLEEKVAHLEKLNEKFERASKVGMRTKEIALKRIEEVRMAVYNIFGWSMKVMGAKYVISSLYAEGPREELEFGLNVSGTMSLLETEYAARLSDEIEQYVQRMNSFPALLAHITMENFEKTTAAL